MKKTLSSGEPVIVSSDGFWHVDGFSHDTIPVKESMRQGTETDDGKTRFTNVLDVYVNVTALLKLLFWMFKELYVKK